MKEGNQQNTNVRLLVIGAGAYQHYIYSAAKCLGFWVCCVDANPNAPMFAMADDYRVLDFADYDAVVMYAKSKNVDAVATINLDQGMYSVEKIKKGLGFKSKDLNKIEAATRKDLMRQVWLDAGVCQPKFWVFSEQQRDAIAGFVSSHSGNLIIKPVDNAAKRGIARLNADGVSLSRLVDDAFAHSKCGKVIVEEMVDGALIFALTYLKADGEAHVFLIQQEISENFVQVGFSAPFSLGSETDERVRDEAITAASCFGPGFYHTEIIVTDDGVPYLVETSPRISYATVALSRLAYGFDPVVEMFEEVFLERFSKPQIPRKTSFACLRHLQPEAGSVFKAETPVTAPQDNLYEAIPLVTDGHVVRPFLTNADRVFYFTAFADSQCSLHEVQEKLTRGLTEQYFLPPSPDAA